MPSDCIFCRISSGEIPAKIAYQDEEILAFHDIHPQAPVHVQIIPRQHIARVSDLTPTQAELMGKLVLVANRLAKEFAIADAGFRLVVNCNPAAGQSVYHLHLHLLGGRPMRWPPG
jgi:histidine triad (HIT) family protein